MAVIVLRTKQKLMSEEDMETNWEDLGKDAPSAKWVWRNTAIQANDIERVIYYNKTKCLIVDSYGIQILVFQPFVEVVKLWEENREQDLDLLEPEEINEENEKNSEDEDD